MTTSATNPTDPQTLIDAYLDGELAVDDAAALERWLAQDAEHRRTFVRQSFVHRQVRDLTSAVALDAIDEATAASAEPVASVVPAVRSARRWFDRSDLRAAAAFAFAGVAVAIWIVVAGQFKPPLDPGERLPMKPMAALLMASHGVQWTKTPHEAPPSGGTGLPIGESMVIESGVIEIEFYSGVRATIEGPATFRLDSPMKMRLSEGRLAAAVPEGAEGFTVVTDRMNVIDLGTDFGVVAGIDDDEVHVFRGGVSMTARGRTDQLAAGQGRHVDVEGVVSEIRADARAFNLPEPIIPEAYYRWVEYRNRLRADPSLVLYYTFQGQEPGDRVADDQSGRGHYGTMTDVAVEEGRVPGKPAVRFTGRDSGVRFRIPGAFESLTAIMWVNIDALPHRFNSLMHTDGWDKSEPHWIVGEYGDLYFNIRDVNFRYGNETPDVDPASVTGAWRMMVGVFDRSAETVTFYIDGHEIFTDPIEADLPLVFDWTEIGNWRTSAQGNHERWLNGRIDEFAMFERAMSADEVAELYRMGKTETQP